MTDRVMHFFRKKGHKRTASNSTEGEWSSSQDNLRKSYTTTATPAAGSSPTVDGEFQSWGGVGLPFNVQKKLHIDQSMNWVGQDPKEAFEIQEKLGEG
jgi:hypothetical protein